MDARARLDALGDRISLLTAIGTPAQFTEINEKQARIWPGDPDQPGFYWWKPSDQVGGKLLHLDRLPTEDTASLRAVVSNSNEEKLRPQNSA
jgi:hypothetical protein